MKKREKEEKGKREKREKWKKEKNGKKSDFCPNWRISRVFTILK